MRALGGGGGGAAWTWAVRGLAPLAALAVDGWGAAIGTLLAQEAGLWATRRLAAGTPHRRLLSQLFLAGYGLRLAIALPAHVIARIGDGNGALYQDDYTYDLVAEWLRRIARGDGISIFPGHQHLLEGLYPYLLFGLYSVFGHEPLLPKVVNCVLAALCSVLVFHIARQLFSVRAALLAGIGAAVLPSLIVWSIATLKETLVLLVALVGLVCVQVMATAPRTSKRLADAVVVLIGMAMLSLDLRAPTVAILGGLVLIVVLARSRPRARPWQLALATLALAVVVTSGLGYARSRVTSRPLSGVVEDAMLQIRHRRAQEAAAARSQIRPEVDVLGTTGSQLPQAEAASDAEPFSVVGDVLEPLGYALLAPAPWQVESKLELAASAEMGVWYVLLLACFFAGRAAPKQPLFAVCLVVYAVSNWLVLAASEGNLGNLFRHRMMLEPALLILGCAGLEWLWLRAGRPWPTHVLPLRPIRGGAPLEAHGDST